jgi:hypothetical protein
LGNLLDTNKCDDTNCFLDADANDDIIPDLEEIELGDLLLDTKKCDDERKYLCEKCRSKYGRSFSFSTETKSERS